MNGVDFVSVKELLGHTQVSTTMIYAHLSSGYKANTVNLLPWTRHKVGSSLLLSENIGSHFYTF